MTQTATTSRDFKLWLVGGIGLVWNAMGIINLAMQMNANTLASMPAEQRAIIESRPDWATVVFAVGVITGLVGCILLLWRKPLAFPVLAASLVAIILHMFSYLGMPNFSKTLGA